MSRKICHIKRVSRYFNEKTKNEYYTKMLIITMFTVGDGSPVPFNIWFRQHRDGKPVPYNSLY